MDQGTDIAPTAGKRPELPVFAADQTGNLKPHDYRLRPPSPYPFCLACLLCRPRDGSLDKKPCKGIARLSLREE